ncbi:heavy-metal-associated domain-containing protein [Desulfopila aestuarii]|uniref:Copper chaperone CopZ n=1 Tax=Desulfopila aestuarii DSM 18488 TaxID=1121416 RepID=A0A1M7Y1N3_9BACT|nr:heavy metal-associated domain-containing protein [Desulfopila aestuarii]SHO45678.1 Copper chaperone CopZ [Desulfopila aestuarii DSM 18488]
MATVKIKGMSCQHCVGSVKKALEAIPGVNDVTVDLEKGEARYEGVVSRDDIKKAILNIGFDVINP